LIENPHSPDERLYIPSIERVWKFLVALLKSFAELDSRRNIEDILLERLTSSKILNCQQRHEDGRAISCGSKHLK
jgi:hypothetical protein